MLRGDPPGVSLLLCGRERRALTGTSLPLFVTLREIFLCPPQARLTVFPRRHRPQTRAAVRRGLHSRENASGAMPRFLRDMQGKALRRSLRSVPDSCLCCAARRFRSRGPARLPLSRLTVFRRLQEGARPARGPHAGAPSFCPSGPVWSHPPSLPEGSCFVRHRSPDHISYTRGGVHDQASL